MKRSGKIIGTALMLLLAGFGPLYAQRGMGGMMTDSVRMNRMRRGIDMNQRQGYELQTGFTENERYETRVRTIRYEPDASVYVPWS